MNPFLIFTMSDIVFDTENKSVNQCLSIWSIERNIWFKKLFLAIMSTNRNNTAIEKDIICHDGIIWDRYFLRLIRRSLVIVQVHNGFSKACCIIILYWKLVSIFVCIVISVDYVISILFCHWVASILVISFYDITRQQLVITRQQFVSILTWHKDNVGRISSFRDPFARPCCQNLFF
jgi:hypothetical protein